MAQNHESDPDDVRVEVWGAREWRYYEIWATCKHCGITQHTFGVTEDELKRANLLEKGLAAREKSSY
ncbi:MAG TPA: hypothetical protein VFM18_18795 [Methanosarcina sp.]|nr:hypothetical protein [Methanosarcina sp.]